MSQREEVLSLYRKILRTARRWTGPSEEREYISKEAKLQFRSHRATEPDQAQGQLVAGQQRLEYAEHYGIPYPRQHHVNQFYRRQYMDTPESSEQLAVKGSGSSDAASKLAAAMARRRQKRSTSSDPT